jgi:nitrogen-specific signal transduction histidine kinase/CheY-like chemotaxis protein
VRDDAGQPVSLFMIGTNVTDQKRLEAQFLRAQRLESVGNLASGIAHDLNNVLTPISISLQLFRDKLTDPADLELLKNLETSTRRGADILKQILTFTRGSDLTPEPIEVPRVLKEIARIVGETFPRDVRLESRAPRDLWMVRGNPTQLYQVLMNLCVNARDAMPAGGRLTLLGANRTLDADAATLHVAARPGPYVVLTVADTGEGMSPEVQERMFDPFFTTKAPGRGTGLGLASVHRIVSAHEGFLMVESAPGQGTRLDVYLPAVPLSAPSDDAKPAEATVEGHLELVLVVDDEAAICRFVSRILQRAHYRCLCAGNGQEAMDLFHRHRDQIRLVISDLMMPVMGGNLAIRAMMQESPELRFVAMSGLLEDEIVAGLPKERVTLLPKPFEAETLLALVQQGLENAAPAANPPPR